MTSPRPVGKTSPRRVGALIAIRALPDLCLGIVSERLGHLDPWISLSWSELESPGTPGAFFYSVVYRRHRTGRQAPALVSWSSAPADQRGVDDKSRPVARA